MTALRTFQAISALVGACVVAIATSGQESARWVKFGGGKAEVLLPSHYEATLDASGTLNVVSKAPAAVRLYLDLHTTRGRSAPHMFGEDFVRDVAKKRNIKPHESGNKVLLMEPGTKGKVQGREVRNMHWQIGFGQSLVVMTLTVPEDEKDSSTVQRFFDVDMEQIIQSIRRTGA